MAQRKLILDRAHLLSMLKDQEFYIRVPEFQYLQYNMRDAVQSAAAVCDTCGDGWRYFRPVVDALFIRLRELVEAQSDILPVIRDYLQTKKKYHIHSIIVFYRSSGNTGINKLTF